MPNNTKCVICKGTPRTDHKLWCTLRHGPLSREMAFIVAFEQCKLALWREAHADALTRIRHR